MSYISIVSTALLAALAGQAYATREVPSDIHVSPNDIAVRVRSNGCSYKSDFQVSVIHTDEGARLAFFRLRADPCRAFIRDGIILKWSRPELGISEQKPILISSSAVSL